MAQGNQGQNQGGGKNNSNKKAKKAANAQQPVTRPAIFNQNVKPPGGAHIVGSVPAPVELTNRPARRN